MSDSPSPTAEQSRSGARNGRIALVALCLVATGTVVASLWSPKPLPAPADFDPTEYKRTAFQAAVAQLNSSFTKKWGDRDLEPAPRADDFTIIRRLSLGLTGSVPSLEEIRALAKVPGEQRIQWWLSYLFEDRRYSDYLAERFARAYVGVENGPFLVYRRRRMAAWLSDEVQANRPYDQLVRSLVGSQGVWTSEPEVNFITATMTKNPETGKSRPDVVKLAARTTRAFLGVRIDCVQCHDDMFGDHWKQRHFHEFAAFYAGADTGITGVRDNDETTYDYRYLKTPDEVTVPAIVPFQAELLPTEGSLRERLAGWITHPENRAFARTTVNRLWALMFNKPIMDPIDDIPLAGKYPPGLEYLADYFITSSFDIQKLLRLIAASRPFQLDSRSDNPNRPITEAHEFNWAAFPLTRLRPDQVIGSVMQASSLRTINADAHIFKRTLRYFGEQDFVKRFGDFGEDEFGEHAGTIPQRLLMLNGKVVQERTKANPFLNASSRISILVKEDDKAVRTAYMCLLTRPPTKAEAEHFSTKLAGKKGDERSREMADLFWTLMNSTEFSWNH
jgi:hypothetical protein